MLLDQNLERSRNSAAYDYLAAHHVHVRWAPFGTTYHQKTLTVDGRTSAIMTLNLVGSDYSGTRDFVVLDTNRADVAAIVATFDADFAGRSISPPRLRTHDRAAGPSPPTKARVHRSGRGRAQARDELRSRERPTHARLAPAIGVASSVRCRLSGPPLRASRRTPPRRPGGRQPGPSTCGVPSGLRRHGHILAVSREVIWGFSRR